MERLEGRVAVVTGAASGIGLAISEAFLGEGMFVVMTDVDDVALGEQVTRLAGQGHDVRSLVVDVADPESVERAGQFAVEVFGQLNVAVNNAGIVNGGCSWELSLDDWRRVIDVDLWGVIHGIRSFVPRILASAVEGHVVNTASMAAVIALAKLGPYTVAKHGVLGVSDVLRAELEEMGAPVGVSVVMPGMIETAMVPMGTIPASTVADNVVDAIRRRRPYVFTDDHHKIEMSARLQAIIDAPADRLA